MSFFCLNIIIGKTVWPGRSFLRFWEFSLEILFPPSFSFWVWSGNLLCYWWQLACAMLVLAGCVRPAQRRFLKHPSYHRIKSLHVSLCNLNIRILNVDPPFYTARSARQKGCVNMLLLSSWSDIMGGWQLMDQSERSRWSDDLLWWSHWWTCIYHLLLKAWPGDLPVGKLGDLQAMFSSVTGRGGFTFHIWILGLSEVRADSWGKFTWTKQNACTRNNNLIWSTSVNIKTNGPSKVCALLTTKTKMYPDPIVVEGGLWPLRCPQRNLHFLALWSWTSEAYSLTLS